jgi:hypothetical protein
MAPYIQDKRLWHMVLQRNQQEEQIGVRIVKRTNRFSSMAPYIQDKRLWHMVLQRNQQEEQGFF